MKPNYSLRGSKSIDLDKAAAIENDETMIINSDHSIITTPIESPQTDMAGSSGRSPRMSSSKQRTNPVYREYDETPSDTSSSEATLAGLKNKRHRTKARSESNRSEKYAKIEFFCFLFNWVFCLTFLLWILDL